MTATNVLYYPYISVPSSSWFSQMLLYWDQVNTITPLEIVENPERLDENTRLLVREGLVNQIIPGAYIYRIPNFSNAFMDYLSTLGEALIAERQADFKSHHERAFNIHIEKLDEIADQLEGIRLARRISHSWLVVERETAMEFMGYLAASLGKVEDLSALPITDDAEYLNHFVQKSNPADEIHSLRARALGDLLPVPSEFVHPAKIADFKARHGDELKRFRRRLERELIDSAIVSDPNLREERFNIFLEDAKDEIKHINDMMAKNGWIRTNFMNLTAVVPSIPGISDLWGLAFAVISAFGKKSQVDDRSPFLYAAEAQRFAA